jgi:hypothetical protein
MPTSTAPFLPALQKNSLQKPLPLQPKATKRSNARPSMASIAVNYANQKDASSSSVA